MQVITDAGDEIPVLAFKTLVKVWFEARRDGGLPNHRIFTEAPEEYTRYCILARIEHDPFRVFYETAGDKLEQLYGSQLAPRPLDELFNPWFRKIARDKYKRAWEEQAPVYDSKVISTIVKKIGYHSLVLPVKSDDDDYVVSVIFPNDVSLKIAQDWKSLVESTPWLGNPPDE